MLLKYLFISSPGLPTVLVAVKDKPKSTMIPKKAKNAVTVIYWPNPSFPKYLVIKATTKMPSMVVAILPMY